MRYISLFSGIEAASVAWEPLGFTPVAFSEIDPFCSRLLEERYPDIPNLGDISTVDWRPYHGSIDLVVGGSPCQAFSVAGPRTGLMDERSALMLEYVRAIREIKPTWCLWENVPGVLSQDGGRAFATLQGALEDCRYSLAWRVLDAQFFGVAQRRRRVFLVGHSDLRCAAAVLFEREKLLGDFGSSKDAREGFAAAAEASARAASGSIANVVVLYENQRKGARTNEPMDARPTSSFLSYALAGNIIGRQVHNGGNGLGASEELCYTLTAMDRHAVCHASSSCTSGNEDVELPISVRRLMPIECERLQGFPDNWTRIEWNGKPEDQCPDSRRYKAIGNSMAVPVMTWIGQRIHMVNQLTRALDEEVGCGRCRI